MKYSYFSFFFKGIKSSSKWLWFKAQMRVLCSTLTFAVVNFYLVFIPPFYIMYVFMMYITFINNHIFYVTNYVFIATLICHTFNMSCYFLKVALQFWQWTLGNYSLVLEINFIHASYAKSVCEQEWSLHMTMEYSEFA